MSYNLYMKENMTNVAIRTGIFTFVIFFVTMSYGAMTFGLMFPKTMAGFCTSLGFHNGAAMHYQRVYHRNPTNQNLHRVLDRFIVAGNHNMVVKYFERFYRKGNESGRKATIAQINAEGRAAAGNNINLQRQWANEDSRLRTAYMYSLININQSNRAREIFIEWMQYKSQNPIDFFQPNFAIEAFFATGTANNAVISAFADYFVAFENQFTCDSCCDFSGQVNIIRCLGGHFIDFFYLFVEEWNNA